MYYAGHCFGDTAKVWGYTGERDTKNREKNELAPKQLALRSHEGETVNGYKVGTEKG